MNLIFMPKLARWLFAIVFLCSVGGAAAADYPKKITFQNVMANKDIALGEVEALLQDHEGFMWLGGRNALLRYDGYDFFSVPIETGKPAPDDFESVSQVVDIFEDSRQVLWVATRDGLFFYDRSREVLIKPVPEDGNVPIAYNSGAVKILEAPTSEIVVAGPGGLLVVNPTTLNAKIYGAKTDANSNGLTNTVVHDVYLDKDNVFWLGTDAGLTRFNWDNKKFTHFIPWPDTPTSLPDNSIWAIDEDQNGKLWLGVHKGIYRFNKRTHEFEQRYVHDEKDRFSLAGDITRDIFIDSNGWVWTGSDKGGLSLYDTAQDRFLSYQHETGKAASLSSNSIRKIYEDTTGDIWVGTYPTGVNFYDKSTAAITVYSSEADPEKGLMSDEVAAIVEDSEGNLWLGGGGVTKFDRKTDTFTHYTPDNGGISSTSIISGLIDSAGDIWFGTWAGSYHRYNPDKNNFEEMPFDGSLARGGHKSSNVLNDSVVWDVYEDKRKNLWLATHNGGLSLYDRKEGKYTIYESSETNEGSISNQLVWTSFEDSQGQFWVGTASGLNLMDRDKGTFKKYSSDDSNPNSLANNSVLSIYEDLQHRLWFGTDAGLHLYRPDTDDFEVFNTQDGFVDHGIRSIVGDHIGNLWMGTNNGVVMFSPDTKEVRNYKSYNGEKIGGFVTGSAITSKAGEIILGGRNGLRIFDVNKLGKNTHVPPVVLTDFRLFTKTVPINGPDKILSRVVNQTDSLIFDYKKTMFSFTFSALNYRDPDKNQYAYKLEGFDEDWREVGNQRTALYTNLNAGKYTFKVRASNNDGVWNDEGHAIKIKQLPPPWRTWWAHTIYTLIVLAIIAQFIRSQRKKRKLIEEQNRILEVRVSERTSELRAKNNDIQAMLSNMRQGLFTVEASGEIHAEYSKHLETIFETEEIAGADAIELLFGKAKLGSNSLDQAKEAIGSIIGEDEMNYSFNAHLLPEEYEADFSGGGKFLALDWNPILDDDIIVKLMISVRDVTQLKQMESEAAAKKRELDIISQLLNVPAKKYLAFAESAKAFISENRSEIRESQNYDEGAVALLFRNMHTIKGNCRTFGFTFFSDVVHEVESVYSTLKASSESPWQPELLLTDLEGVDAILAEYENVYYTVLGRGSNTSDSRDTEGFWADAEIVAKIRGCIDTLNEKHPSLQVAADLAPITNLIDSAMANPLPKVLADVVDSLPSIAQQLNKVPPQVNFVGQEVNIKYTEESLLGNIFAHILRNCVDHGLESTAERIAAGKTEQGAITLNTRCDEQYLVIEVSDDGRGLNVERLYEKGLELALWSEDQVPTYDQISALIFHSGVSTKLAVTDISGRGVGMDAVKQFLLERNGDISLSILNAPEKFTEKVFLPFSIEVKLPVSACF